MVSTGLKNTNLAAPEISAMSLQEASGAVQGVSNRNRVKAFGSKAKNKVGNILSLPVIDTDIDSTADEDVIFADAAFNPSKVVDDDYSGLAEEDNSDREGGLESVKNALLHPRRAMRHKATRTTAGKVSSASKPYLSRKQQLEFLDANDDLTTAKSNAPSTDASDTSSEQRDGSVAGARKRVERLEDHRESLKTAWVIDRHVHRIRVVHRSIPKPCQNNFFITKSGQNGLSKQQFDWPRYVGCLAVWYTYGFTAQHIDDLESPPFDIRDLALTIERLATISGPWQTFFLSCRQVYTWESPKRTIKWMLLFWTLWYTNHIAGYFYFWIVYATIRNRYWPSSLSSIRESMLRGMDKKKKAQAWSELINRHGRDDWMEPLLASAHTFRYDELGPLIQLQLGDLVNFLEVLSNFYNWERPRRTAETLFIALVLLLITLSCDTTACMKLLWIFIGGGFFFTFPIATNFPKYRRLVNLFRWFFWDIPSHAELGIMHLQEKAIVLEARATITGNKQADESEYETAGEDAVKLKGLKTQYFFRAYHGKSSGTLLITRSELRWTPKQSFFTSQQVVIPFSRLQELLKLEQSNQSGSTKPLRPKMEGLLIIYGGCHSASAPSNTRSNHGTQQLKLDVISRKRHEIFCLILAWSGQKWQPLPVERHGDKRDQHQTFDNALKRALQ